MVAVRATRLLFKLCFGLLVLGVLYDYYHSLYFLRSLIHGRRSNNGVNGWNGILTTIIDQPTQLYDTQEKITKCPEFSIRNISEVNYYSSSKCRPRPITGKDCRAALRKYGRTPKDLECKHHDRQIAHELCRFTDSSIRTSNTSHLKLECNLDLCEANPIRIGVVQPNFGLLVRPEFWYIANNQLGIDLVIRKILADNVQNGYDFCIITCRSKKKIIRQALVFPPFVKLKKNVAKEDRKVNVNIVVLDSVSRQHFYRQLPNTVEQLKKLEKKEDTTVFDFEMLQSLAPRTFPNMRAMFSGIVDVDSDDEAHTYGLDSLFGKYSNLGYQSVLHEDSCWYDSWGALITDNKHNLEIMASPGQYGDRWQEIQRKLRHLPIDSYGLTHFSCEVFMQYGKTNQFNYPPKVCYNGELLPAYFLNYTYKFLETVESIHSSYPAFIYTHLNTGHEMSGKRIAYSDLILSQFVEKSSKMANTLTIFLSDHGPKTTKFSQEFLAGRYEIGQALMFMLIPSKVQDYLGRDKLNALETNQHRLVSHLDLFFMLMSLHSSNPLGLFTPISVDRDCHDIPIYSFISCLCDGWSEHLVDFHEQVHWLAEFAVGYLNNKITKSINKDPNLDTGGYGNCERLIGKRYDKIRRKINDDGSVLYTFDVIVDKYRDEEVFEVAVTIPEIRTKYSKTYKYKPPVAQMTRWRRVSIFQHFSKCRDETIDIQLCICRKETSDTSNPARDLAKLLSINSFNVETKLKFLHSKCLAVLIRSRPRIFKSFEVTNMCSDRQYDVSFHMSSENTFNFAPQPPLNITIKPWCILYLTSIPLYEVSNGSDLLENMSYGITYYESQFEKPVTVAPT